ncbi:MAG: hypothetical protein QXP61_08350 [Nitrososphaerales archaeon]
MLIPLAYGQSFSLNPAEQEIISGTHKFKLENKEYEVGFTILGGRVSRFGTDFGILVIEVVTSKDKPALLELSLPRDFVSDVLRGLPPLDTGKVGKAMGQLLIDTKGIYVEGTGSLTPHFLEVADSDILSLGCNVNTVLKVSLPPATTTVTINNVEPYYGISPAISVQTDRCMYLPGEPVIVRGKYFNSYPESTDVSLRITSADRRSVFETNTGLIDVNQSFSTVLTPKSPGIYYINATSTKLGVGESGFFIVKGPALFPIEIQGNTYMLGVDSTSPSYDFIFSMINKQFLVVLTGEDKVEGRTKITLPKDLLDGDLFVKLDGFKSEDHQVSENMTHSIIVTNYARENTKSIISITGTTVVPEFSTGILIVSIAIGMVLIIVRKKSLNLCSTKAGKIVKWV